MFHGVYCTVERAEERERTGGGVLGCQRGRLRQFSSATHCEVIRGPAAARHRAGPC